MDSKLGRRHEILGILCFAVALLCALSLFSYDMRGGENWVGPVGEAIARFFVSAFGLGVVWLPVELAMLTELGFGLDLSNCAATGETTDLIYVSPKSGGAVSRGAGEPYRDRLLRLPPFLREGEAGSNGWSDQDLQDGFRLTGMFLLRHVLEPRGQGHSDARDGFINAVTRHRLRISSVG